MRYTRILAAASLLSGYGTACGLDPELRGRLDTRDTTPDLLGAADAGAPSRPDGGALGSKRPDAGADAGEATGANEIYAMQIVMGQSWTLPILNTHPATVTMLARGAVRISGTEVTIDGKLCDLRIKYEGSLTPVFPQATIDAFPNIQGTAPLRQGANGLEFDFPATTVLSGWTSTDVSAALPITATDERLADQDGDGNPGVTMDLAAPGTITGSVYIALRAVLKFSGTIQDIDRVTGVNDSRVEQSIVNATSGLVPKGVMNATPIPEASKFTMVRMPDASADCAAVKGQAATLFP